MLQFVGESSARRVMRVFSYQDKFTTLCKEVDASIADLQMSLQTEALNKQGNIPAAIATSLVQALESLQASKSLETIHSCVQCGKTFRDCSYHPVQFYDRPSYYEYVLPCCGRNVGSEFLPFPSDGDADIWLSVTQTDLDSIDGVEVSAQIGLLRTGNLAMWVCQSGVPIYLVSFDTHEIEAPTVLPNGAVVFDINGGNTPLTNRWNQNLVGFGKRWHGWIRGVRLEVKSPTSDVANISNYDDNISIFDLRPSLTTKDYSLPESIKNFKAFPPCSLNGKLFLSLFRPKVLLNPNGSSYKSDIFESDFLLISPKPSQHLTHQQRSNLLSQWKLLRNITLGTHATTDGDITLIDAVVEVSLDEGKSWRRADSVDILMPQSGLKGFPIKIGEGEVVKVKVVAGFDVDGKKRGWTNSSYLARNATHPALIRYRLEEAFGTASMLIMPFRNPPPCDYLFVYVDDVDDQDRFYARISKPTVDDSSLNRKHLTSRDITATMIRRWVHAAKKMPKTSDERVKELGQVSFYGMSVRVDLDDTGKDFALGSWRIPEEIFL
ncbi:hypothetical protein BC829DRAFT_406850 [Chytridium lagenaria]|nr:hypothetical protein BC829DRAFT_406850 [Chytridium lagenaria]